MKKLITLMIAAGAFVAVNAQTTKEEARRVILGQEKNGSTSREGRDVVLGGGNDRNDYPRTNPNNYPGSSRQAQIDQVNREYDQKIWSIKNNNTLSADEKARMIRQLEQDRAKRIRQINQSSGGDYGKNGKRYDDNNSNGKGYGKNNNPGKRLGWEKGKGNPHKYGGKTKGKKG